MPDTECKLLDNRPVKQICKNKYYWHSVW